jgi:hypothetical protein
MKGVVMIATDNFKMRLSPQDKKMLKAVSSHFQRSQSDTVKVMIRGLYKVIEAGRADPKKKIAA